MKQKLTLYSEALLDFDKAAELSPNDALINYLRGDTKYKSGKTKAANKDMQTALKRIEATTREATAGSRR